MTATERRTAGQRREEILRTSLELFARDGLHGVTTRMIADAAGVSEALLYRHFRGKEALFQELQRWCLRDTMTAAEKLAQLPPNTATLVIAIYFTVRQIMSTVSGDGKQVCIKRIMLSSLIGDGEFARGALKTNFGRYIPKLVSCLEAAHHAGDLMAPPRHAALRVWLAHHLAVMTSSLFLPPRPVVDYELAPDQLIDELTRFALRGLGMTEQAIDREFDPRALAAFTSRLIDAPAEDADRKTTTHRAAPRGKGTRS